MRCHESLSSPIGISYANEVGACAPGRQRRAALGVCYFRGVAVSGSWERRRGLHIAFVPSVWPCGCIFHSFLLACLHTMHSFIHSARSIETTKNGASAATAHRTEKQASDELPRASKTAVKLVSSFGLGLSRLRIRRDHPIFGRALVALSYVRQMRRTRTCSQHISKVGLGLW